MPSIIPYTGQEKYTLHLGSLTRELSVVAVSDTVWIAPFILPGDPELNRHSAEMLIEKMSGIGYDYIVVPETKAIPLGETICQLLYQKGINKDYIVLRKDVKVYIKDPLATTVNSITTQRQQQLLINGADARKIEGKKVALVDDVVSTGNSFRAMLELMKMAQAKPVFAGAVLREGAEDLSDIEEALGDVPLVTLETLPLFIKE